MRSRALIHVNGPAGSGKTKFVECLVKSWQGFILCVRGERDAKTKRAKSVAPKGHAELDRYRVAGAAAVAHYRFGKPDLDEFFACDAMQDYSDLVVIEGDCPVDCVDLMVFVAPPLPEGQSLLCRAPRERGVGQPSDDDVMQVLTLLRNQDNSKTVDAMLSAMRAKSQAAHVGRERWKVAEDYAGIEVAQLVVVNTRGDGERVAAESLAAEVPRLRGDEAVFDDVIGLRGKRVAVTVVVANLADADDPGARKALGKVKRVARSARE